jgi:hypothetical protein
MGSGGIGGTLHPPIDHEPADRGFIEHGLRELVRNAPMLPTVPLPADWHTTPNLLNTGTLVTSHATIIRR